MVDLFYLSALFIGISLALFGLRFAHLRKHLSTLQNSANDAADRKSSEFEETVYARRKSERDPQRLLNLASQHFALKDISSDLEKYIRQNRTSEKIDIIAVGSWLLLVITRLVFDFFPDYRIAILLLIILMGSVFLTGRSIWSFLKLYRRTNRLEDAMGKCESNK